jgi:hypothetical protein
MRENMEKARMLADDLRSKGADVWMDETKLDPVLV